MLLRLPHIFRLMRTFKIWIKSSCFVIRFVSLLLIFISFTYVRVMIHLLLGLMRPQSCFPLVDYPCPSPALSATQD